MNAVAPLVSILRKLRARRRLGKALRKARHRLLETIARSDIAHWRSFADQTQRGLGRIQGTLTRVPFPDSIDAFDTSWRLPDRAYPYSCTDEEGTILASTIARNGLQCGFEIATAFGYSTLYAALALHRNGGSLTTLDCYVEEWKESYMYEPEELRRVLADIKADMARGIDPRGLAMARANARTLDVESCIAFEVGVSPEDIAPIAGGARFDFAFIDGGHFGDQPLQDFEAIRPFLADTCAVFFHDNNGNASVARAVAAAAAALGSPPTIFPTRFRLTLVGRGLDSAAVRSLHRAVRWRHGP